MTDKNEKTQDHRPVHCRNRLQSEGEPYPRSGCAVQGCGGALGERMCHNKYATSLDDYLHTVKRMLSVLVDIEVLSSEVIHLLTENEIKVDIRRETTERQEGFFTITEPTGWRTITLTDRNGRTLEFREGG